MRNRPPMHVLTNGAAHGLTPIDERGSPYPSGIVVFGGRVRTQSGVVMIYAGTDALGDPYCITEAFHLRLPAILRRLTQQRNRA